ncbi:MAG TPA: tagatose 1,6-diphosphate aldolase [Candidatus Dormibacteraeota bacterium]|nr:tagatose 1,6-diphosphate aldolase [Candidatus Dormibacteraeota bacterium]
MKISPGKWKGLQAVSNSRGVIAALAIDQRSALRNLFAKAMCVEPEDVPRQALEKYKEAVSRILTPHASAILLDPEYGLPAARQRAANAGLLLAYEQSGYDKSEPGRLPRLLDNYSVKRLVTEGADCVKVLLYYSPFSSTKVNAQKHAWVQRIGAECTASDVPFFLEIVSYDDGMDEQRVEFARIKPDVTARSMEEFSRPEYAVDVIKVGVPVNMAFVKGQHSDSGTAAYTREEAKAHFLRAASSARRPFIYLSEGVSNEMFNDALELAVEAGANFCGVLCGRATWKDGVPIFATKGVQALEDWLSNQGTKNIQEVNARVAHAKPWFEIYGATSASALTT